MKNINTILMMCVILLLFTSCAKSLVINYSNSQINTGQIVILPTSPVSGSFTMNDSLLVDKRRFTKITINNIPEGEYQVHLTGQSKTLKEGLDYYKNVQVKINKENTQLVAVPPKSNGYWIENGGKTFIILFTAWFLPFAIFY